MYFASSRARAPADVGRVFFHILPPVFEESLLVLGGFAATITVLFISLFFLMSLRMSSTHSRYDVMLKRLYDTNLFNPVKLGLTNIELLLQHMENPYVRQSKCNIVHVAGTNGKGSTSWKIAKSLKFAGYTTGLFVSPHLSSFRERCMVDFNLIGEEQVCSALDEIYSIIDSHQIPCTFFEITTAMALRHFQKLNCDAIVLETGLGGRLDSTNIVSTDLQVVTNIGLDHQHILGDTIEKIAYEKAGIFKKGKIAVVGEDCPRHVFQRQQEVVGLSKLVWATRDNKNNDSDHNYDEYNSNLARVSLNHLYDNLKGDWKPTRECWDEAVERGCVLRPNCRFQTVHCKVKPDGTVSTGGDGESHKTVKTILDVAHNPPAMAKLSRHLVATTPSDVVRVVIGCSGDKSVANMISILNDALKDREVVWYVVVADHPRSASVSQVIELSSGIINSSNAPQISENFSTSKDGSIAETIRDCLMQSRPSDVVLITGSVYIMKDACEAVGIKMESDNDWSLSTGRDGQEFFEASKGSM